MWKGMREIAFDHGSGLWYIRETDHANNRERDTVGGWYSSSDVENAMHADDPLKFEAWGPIQKHGIWP